jgi:hypothetical protein
LDLEDDDDVDTGDTTDDIYKGLGSWHYRWFRKNEVKNNVHSISLWRLKSKCYSME